MAEITAREPGLKRSLSVWQAGVPIAAVIVLGYTLYRNVYPYPSGDAYWFPIVGGGWLAVAIIGVIVAPRTAARLGSALTAREGIAAEQGLLTGDAIGAGDGITAAEA